MGCDRWSDLRRGRDICRARSDRSRGHGRQNKNFRVVHSFPGGISEREPPDPIPNSEVKTLRADGSFACCDARVGHCQGPNEKPPLRKQRGLFAFTGHRVRRREAAGPPRRCGVPPSRPVPVRTIILPPCRSFSWASISRQVPRLRRRRRSALGSFPRQDQG